MQNLADIIENFILRELYQEGEAGYLVQRNELAEHLDCAPSQISYVLSTRFTPERGYLVQSRRGSGGFVRILRLNEELPRGSKEKEQQPPKQPPTAEGLLKTLQEERVITQRERRLLAYFLRAIKADEGKKLELLREALRHMREQRGASR